MLYGIFFNTFVLVVVANVVLDSRLDSFSAENNRSQQNKIELQLQVLSFSWCLNFKSYLYLKGELTFSLDLLLEISFLHVRFLIFLFLSFEEVHLSLHHNICFVQYAQMTKFVIFFSDLKIQINV